MYNIRAYTPADRTQTAHLLRRLWSQDVSLNEKYLVWRYEQNPYLTLSLAIAEYDNRIAAVRGAYGMNWRIGNSTEFIPCFGDTVVDQLHEGKKLVQILTQRLLLDLADKDVHYVVNQNPGPAVEKISLRTGWRRVGHRNRARYVSQKHSGNDGFEQLDANALNAAGNMKISVQPCPPAEILGLLGKRRSKPPISHCIDEHYLRWRFENPLCEYRWLCAYSHQLVGYLVLARSNVAPARLGIRLLDLWGIDSAVQSTLLNRAMQWGEFQDVRLWWNRFPRQISQLLSEHGFEGLPPDAPRRPALLIRSTSASEDFSAHDINLLDMKNWDASMIHSDLT